MKMMKLKSIISESDLLPRVVNFLFAGLAFLLVGVSFLKPWYTLPVLSGGEYSTVDSVYTLYFKGAIILLTMAFSWVVFRRWKKLRSFGSVILRYGMCCLVLMLWFPAWVIVRDAEMAGDAAWLQQQHDTMTWLGGDVYRAHAERSVELGTGVNAQDPPSRLAVYKPPAGELGIERVNDWIWWLGYGPAFTQFVGKGWFFAVAGYGLGCVCLCGFYWRRSVMEARKLLRTLLVMTAILLSLTVGSSVLVVVSARNALSDTEKAMSEGDYRAARQSLQKAVRWMPSLACDSGVIRQLGYFDKLLGKADSAHSLLYQIYWYEQEGYYARARSLVDELSQRRAANDSELDHFSKRALSRHQLRIAINYINSGRYTLAMKHLGELLEVEENCMQACFHRQLLALQVNDVVANREMNERLNVIYQGVKSKNKRSVIAASAWMLSQGELRAGNTTDAWKARKKSKGQ